MATERSELKIPARYYARLCELLGGSGVDITALLEATHIDERTLRSPSGALTLPQVERLIDEAVQSSGRSDLAFELGKALKLSSHGTLGFAFLSSPTLDYALRLASRYFRLILPMMTLRYRPLDKAAELIATPSAGLSHSSTNFHVELVATALYWEIRELLGGAMPTYPLYLSMAEPPHRKRYRELPEAQVHYAWQDLPGLRMLLPAETVKRPLKLADAWALEQAETRCREQVNAALDRGDIGKWIGMMLQEANGALPTQREIAHTLNISPRTLDRYLKREGVSFRELSNRTQHERACRMLSETRLSVTAIAHELGYTDVSNFARAFRREGDGSGPREWRRSRPAN